MLQEKFFLTNRNLKITNNLKSTKRLQHTPDSSLYVHICEKWVLLTAQTAKCGDALEPRSSIYQLFC